MVINLYAEQVDAVIIQELRRNLKLFKENLESEDIKFFSYDEEEGRRMCEEHIKAFELVVDFYGG